MIRFRFDFLAASSLEDVDFSFDPLPRRHVGHTVTLTVLAGEQRQDLEILHGGGGQRTPTSTTEWSFDLRASIPEEIAEVTIELVVPTLGIKQSLSVTNAELTETRKKLNDQFRQAVGDDAAVG